MNLHISRLLVASIWLRTPERERVSQRLRPSSSQLLFWLHTTCVMMIVTTAVNSKTLRPSACLHDLDLFCAGSVVTQLGTLSWMEEGRLGAAITIFERSCLLLVCSAPAPAPAACACASFAFSPFLALALPVPAPAVHHRHPRLRLLSTSCTHARTRSRQRFYFPPPPPVPSSRIRLRLRPQRSKPTH